MRTDHSKTIRGLSIATIAVAGLCILACIIGFIALGVGGAALSSVTPDVLDYYDHSYGYGYDYGYMDDDAEVLALLGLMFGLGGVAIFVELIASAVALIAGIFGLRFFDKPEKMNLLFGWSLAGAIVSFLGGNIATMVLLIIVCVFAYKDKQQTAAQPVTVATNVAAYTVPPVVPATPAAPTAPTTQPVSTQPTQVTADQPTATQPEQPEAPVTATVQTTVQATTNPEGPKAE